MKKAGCLLFFALPAIVFVYAVYSAASRFEAASISARENVGKVNGRPPLRPATPAEEHARMGEADALAIRRVLDARGEFLARRAAEQVEGARAEDVGCRAVAWTSIQQSASAAWWNVDFECRWKGEKVLDKTSVSVRLAKKGGAWVVD